MLCSAIVLVVVLVLVIVFCSLQVENGLRPQKAVNQEQRVWIRVDAKEAEDENDDEDEGSDINQNPCRHPYSGRF
jgi:hypothetical protein